MNIDSLKSRYEELRHKLDRKLGQEEALTAELETLKDTIKSLILEADNYEKASAVLNSIGEGRQENLQVQIESLVTKGLQTIFDPSLSFHLISSNKSRQQVIEFVVRTKMSTGHVVEATVDSSGGGLEATVGFLLRLVVTILTRKNKPTTMILDETFAHVSAGYLPTLAEFLKEINQKTGIKFIIVTHQHEFLDIADVAYEFQLKNAITKVKRLK